MPPVPLNFRVATKDTSLPVGGGPDGRSPIFVPKGMTVTYSVYAMHRRKDFYGADSHEFRPERWEENGRRGWDYLPFNGGPRICLGRMYLPSHKFLHENSTNNGLEQYALTEASYTLVKLLQHFDTLENADPTLVRPAIQSNLTMSHEQGVKIRLYRSKA